MTTIEWTDETWNPVVGCSVASPGCDHCYAANVATRALQPAHAGLAVRGQWTGEVRVLPDRLDVPAQWSRPRRVFVCSMSDLFHPGVPTEFVLDVWSAMSRSPQHTFQVLTKRPQRAREILGHVAWKDMHSLNGPGTAYLCDGAGEMPLDNVWLGTSIESDRYTWRVNHLRAAPAAVRFLSIEPLLGPLPSLALAGIDWVIVGGESGHGARPMHPDWVRDIRDRCIDAGVPFFFKQWGAWSPPAGEVADASAICLEADGTILPFWDTPADDSAVTLHRAGKKAGGRELDGRTWDQMPS
jgi:protein gp37